MGNQDIEITFLINSLGEGGAQRIVVTLAKQFAQEGKKVRILSLATNDLHQLPAEVECVYFSKHVKDSMFLIPYYAWKLKHYVHANNINLVQSHIFRASFVNLFSKVLGSQHQVQVVNHSVVSRFENEGISGKINLLFIRLLYEKADLIVHISKRMKLAFHEYFSMNKEEVVIYNPHHAKLIVKQAQSKPKDFTFDKKKRYLISVGRLIELKRFEDVILALKALPSDVELLLLGEGKERASLEKLVQAHRLGSQVHFLGQVNNPFSYLQCSDLFILSSSVEGFPNVLVEAMLCKTAVVSSDCTSGPRELLAPSTKITQQLSKGVEKAEYGYLYAVGDVASLTQSIQELLEDKEQRECYVEKAFQRANSFSVENISLEYEKIFKIKK